MTERDPIFIGGLMKSGTTLLRVLLGNHPHLFAGLETHWFTPAFRDHWRDPGRPPVATLLGLFELDRADYHAICQGSDDAVDFFERFMGFCAARAGKRRWVEKTPGNAAHAGAIFARWPDARLLHVIRDPRDVYASWKKNRKYDLERFLGDARAIAASLGERLGRADQRYREVRYHELVSRPEAVMRQVIEFVNEPWAPEVAAHAGDRREHDRVLVVTGKSSATLDSIGRPIFRDSVGQWRAILSASEAGRIARELAAYGERTGCFDD